MKPLSALSSEEARRLKGVLFDLDDTFLSHGTLTRGAYDALWALHDAGLKLVAVTGRPGGWGDVLARQWPVDGVVAENGAVYVRRNSALLERHDAVDEVERRGRRERLDRLAAHVSRVVPEARLTDDAAARRSDVTWDVGEAHRLPEARVEAIVREIEAAGARWLRSSVHLHATFDVDDKASGSLRFCVEQLGDEAASALVRYAFVGDSANDAPCFAAFRTTIGVANVRESLSRLSVPPRYVTTHPMGEGFAEVAGEVLQKRAAAGAPRVC